MNDDVCHYTYLGYWAYCQLSQSRVGMEMKEVDVEENYAISSKSDIETRLT